MVTKTKLSTCILAILLSFSLTASAPPPDQVILQTSEDRVSLKNEIVSSILEAKESILIFTFSLSDKEVIEALNIKANQGLSVTIAIDKDHMGDITAKKAPSIELLTRRTGEGHLHHKILVVDREEVWIGSANFTTSGYTTQENLMCGFISPVIGQFLHEEVEAFRGAPRTEHAPIATSFATQNLYFCHLPHDGFPPRPIEAAINYHSKWFLIDQIDGAQESLKVAMMVLTNNDLTDALIRAHRRGLKVEVVASDLGGNMPKLKAAGIEVICNPKPSFMHNKMMIVDDQILVNGSANWSQSSFTRSDESFIILDSLNEEQKEYLTFYFNYLKGINK